MIWTIITAILSGILSLYPGYKRLLYLHQLTLKRLGIAAVILLTVFLILQLLYTFGYFSQEAGALFMSCTYASFTGFLLGATVQQYKQKKDSGDIQYAHRSIWTDILPYAVAVALILFGIQRMAVLSDLPITPIRVTSGISLMAVGLWGFTLRAVPEFRGKGIILLDEFIAWEQLVTYSWYGELVLEVEYEKDGYIRSFKTLIPEEDHKEAEKLLGDQMKRKMERESFDEYEEVED